MTEEQFKQWREAKAWELAVLIQGPVQKPVSTDDSWTKFLRDYGHVQKRVLRILEGNV